MTRINCIPVSELTRQHLVAEYREITRARSWNIRRRPLPDSYRMGKGHCLFFHDKGLYLQKRHRQLIAEMKRRGYNPTLPPLDLSHWPEWAMNDWQPDTEAMTVNRERIAERLAGAENGHIARTKMELDRLASELWEMY